MSNNTKQKLELGVCEVNKPKGVGEDAARCRKQEIGEDGGGVMKLSRERGRRSEGREGETEVARQLTKETGG